MSRAVYPMWIMVLVPALIAVSAFVAAQIVAGTGVIIAAGGATLWTAFVARKGMVARHD